MEIKFHRTYRTAFITGIMGLALFVLYKFGHINLFYSHYYLIFISFISILFSRNRYALANEFGLTIFIGPLFKKWPLILKWKEVDSLEIASSNISWMGTFGARVQAPAKVGVAVPALKIALVEPLSKDLQNKIRNYLNKSFYPPKEAVNDIGDEICLKEPPRGGFESFLKRANYIRKAYDNKLIES